jgi:hypothetical protein
VEENTVIYVDISAGKEYTKNLFINFPLSPPSLPYGFCSTGRAYVGEHRASEGT